MTDAVGPWSVSVSGEARRSLHQLPESVAPAIVEFITGPLADNPLRLSKPLRYELEGLRTARRGDYRVLIRLTESERNLLVVRIQHRAEVNRTR